MDGLMDGLMDGSERLTVKHPTDQKAERKRKKKQPQVDVRFDEDRSKALRGLLLARIPFRIEIK